MNNQKLTVSILPNKIAVCQIEKDAEIPSWATNDSFYSITKTDDELSIVCSENNIPRVVKSERGFRAIKVEGPLDFALTGILASLANSLAEANISIFAISTYDTDYILVKDENLENAVKVLGTFCNIKG